VIDESPFRNKKRHAGGETRTPSMRKIIPRCQDQGACSGHAVNNRMADSQFDVFATEGDATQRPARHR
jgi:hypothetical protein